MCLDNPFQTCWKTEQSVFLSCAKIICRIYLKKLFLLLSLTESHWFYWIINTIFYKKTQWKPPYLLFSGRCIFEPVTSRCGHCPNSAAHLFFLGKHVPLFILEKEAQVDKLDSARTAPGVTHNTFIEMGVRAHCQHCCSWSQLCTHSTAWASAAQMVSLGSAFSQDYFSLLKQSWKTELGYRLDIFCQTSDLPVMFTENK